MAGTNNHRQALDVRTQQEIDAHVLRAIWCSIEAHQHDRDKQPAAARDASRDAAAHVRCAMFLAGLRA